MVRRSLSPELHEIILEQRSNPTKAEEFLWQHLRNHRLGGYKFRRQHPAGGYILDFYCPSARLGIELDGAIHQNQREYDQQREDDLRGLGITIIRFWNSEVIENSEIVLDKVLKKIGEMNFKKKWFSSLTPSPLPFRRMGEG